MHAPNCLQVFLGPRAVPLTFPAYTFQMFQNRRTPAINFQLNWLKVMPLSSDWYQRQFVFGGIKLTPLILKRCYHGPWQNKLNFDQLWLWSFTTHPVWSSRSMCKKMLTWKTFSSWLVFDLAKRELNPVQSPTWNPQRSRNGFLKHEVYEVQPQSSGNFCLEDPWSEQKLFCSVHLLWRVLCPAWLCSILWLPCYHLCRALQRKSFPFCVCWFVELRLFVAFRCFHFSSFLISIFLLFIFVSLTLQRVWFDVLSETCCQKRSRTFVLLPSPIGVKLIPCFFLFYFHKQFVGIVM